ncbi:MAG: YceD family protein [Thermodesulfobacteriota bacterium]
MTLIDLRDIPETGRSYRFRVDPGAWRPVEDEEGIAELAGPLDVQAEIQRIGRRIVLNGRVRGGLLLRCDRCLKAFQADVDTAFRTYLAIPGDSITETDIELDEEDLEVDFVSSGKIEILDLVRDQLLLNQPMKNLCSEDCKGLCDQCGKDLNQGPCECRSDKGNPAFQELMELKPGGGRD